MPIFQDLISQEKPEQQTERQKTLGLQGIHQTIQLRHGAVIKIGHQWSQMEDERNVPQDLFKPVM